MERHHHFFAQLISFFMSAVMLCGILPVQAQAETIEFSLSETLVYMAPGESTKVSFTMTGSTSEPIFSIVDNSTWYGSGSVEYTVENN